jgi:DNA-binding transcriptional regulator YdaS (Cro superfamily)
MVTRDDGVGLILVIGTMTVMMVLVLVGGSIVDRALKTGRQQTAFTNALAAAEAGIYTGLARVQGAYDTYGTDYITPHSVATTYEPSPTCATAPVQFPTASMNAQQEAAWAETELVRLAAVNGCLEEGGGGQYVLMRPNGRQAVYAMGWAPSFVSATSRSRVIKTEYIFAPYKPGNAVLTGGDLELNSSTTVTGAAAGASNANVHSNGQVVVSNGNPRVDGTVTQSASGALPSSNKFSGGSSRSAVQTIPTISATTVYNRNVGLYPNAWFDLCPDGKARQGASTGPCTGALLGDYGSGGANAGGTFRNGWKYSAAGPTWLVSGGFQDGIYFVSKANVGQANGVGNPSVARATIIASAVNGIACSKSLGNIDWDHVDIGAPYIDNTFMVADQDLRTGSNFAAGSASGGTVISGLFVGGDQIEMQTSSNGAYGAVIAGDTCDPSGTMVDKNVIKNPTIYFDPNGYAPFTDVVNTTLWLELVS